MILKKTIVDRSYVVTAAGELKEALIDPKESAQVLYHDEIQRAFHQGKEEGERRGYAKACEEHRHLSTLLHTVADRLMEHKKELLAHLKPEIVELSFQIAETIIRGELSHPKPFLTLLNSLLNQAVRTFAGLPLKVFLAPEDLLRLGKQMGEEHPSLQLHADPRLRPGDCRIESESGLLNAEIGRELNLLKNKLLCQNFSPQN